MHIDFTQLNWLSIFIAFVIGQVYLTLWFAVFFAEAWAKAYHPSKTKAEHTKEVPGYTYGIGAVCTLLLVMGMALLFQALQISTLGQALGTAGFLSLFIVLATLLPGYAFLKRWSACVLSAGSQVTVIFILSIILVLV